MNTLDPEHLVSYFPTQTAPTAMTDRQAHTAADGFQALLIQQMFAVSQQSLAEKTAGGNNWQSMLYQQFAEQMAQADVLGLRKQLVEHLMHNNRRELTSF